jgi:quercetin dioxygenase-like cupin family protein
MIVSAYFPDHLDGNAMTEKSSPTVNSYSVHEDQLKWFDVPLVAGGKAAVLHGDPTKAGTVVLRFKFPPNRQTPPHRHPYAEYTTILSGKVYYGEGEKFDMSNPEIGKVGTFAIVPAGQAHFVDLGRRSDRTIAIRGPIQHDFCRCSGRSATQVTRLTMSVHRTFQT